jgi:hypothetical protein
MNEWKPQTYEECKADKYQTSKVSEETWIKMFDLINSLSPTIDVKTLHWVVNCTHDELSVYFFRDKLHMHCSIDESDNSISGFLVISNDGYPLPKHHCEEYFTLEETKKYILAWHNKEVWK